jgi:hypothetical protein
MHRRSGGGDSLPSRKMNFALEKFEWFSENIEIVIVSDSNSGPWLSDLACSLYNSSSPMKESILE